MRSLYDEAQFRTEVEGYFFPLATGTSCVKKDLVSVSLSVSVFVYLSVCPCVSPLYRPQREILDHFRHQYYYSL